MQGTSYMIVLEAYVLQYFRITNMTYFDKESTEVRKSDFKRAWKASRLDWIQSNVYFWVNQILHLLAKQLPQRCCYNMSNLSYY